MALFLSFVVTFCILINIYFSVISLFLYSLDEKFGLLRNCYSCFTKKEQQRKHLTTRKPQNKRSSLVSKSNRYLALPSRSIEINPSKRNKQRRLRRKREHQKLIVLNSKTLVHKKNISLHLASPKTTIKRYFDPLWLGNRHHWSATFTNEKVTKRTFLVSKNNRSLVLPSRLIKIAVKEISSSVYGKQRKWPRDHIYPSFAARCFQLSSFTLGPKARISLYDTHLRSHFLNKR